MRAQDFSAGLAVALAMASVSGCASCPCGKGAAAAEPGTTGGSVDPSGATDAENAPADGAAPVSAAGPSPLENAAAPVAGGQPPPALPEVVVESVGMHVGGGKNDDAEKAPFKTAIESRFADFRRCYVHIEQPGKGGTFGVDLFVDRDGGKAEVRQPRTGMSGEKFRNCVVEVFNGIDFERPRAGPTVVSYSLRFRVGGQ